VPYLIVGFPLVLVTLTFSLARNLPASDIHTLSSTPAPTFVVLTTPDRCQGCPMRRALLALAIVFISHFEQASEKESGRITKDHT